MEQASTAHPQWAGYYKSPEPDLFPAVRHAQANGLSPQMLYRLAKDGDIKLTKIRGRTFIRRTDWQRFLRTISAPPPADPLNPETPFKI